MVPGLCGAEYLRDYKILATFEDGKTGVIVPVRERRRCRSSAGRGTGGRSAILPGVEGTCARFGHRSHVPAPFGRCFPESLREQGTDLRVGFGQADPEFESRGVDEPGTLARLTDKIAEDHLPLT